LPSRTEHSWGCMERAKLLLLILLPPPPLLSTTTTSAYLEQSVVHVVVDHLDERFSL